MGCNPRARRDERRGLEGLVHSPTRSTKTKSDDNAVNEASCDCKAIVLQGTANLLQLKCWRAAVALARYNDELGGHTAVSQDSKHAHQHKKPCDDRG